MKKRAPNFLLALAALSVPPETFPRPAEASQPQAAPNEGSLPPRAISAPGGCGVLLGGGVHTDA
ncbi:MAG: hypothetical protein M0006_04525 [Magnetospirillum sp.]|nr:hypothetical protein [Magnetospirillum sp.]